MFVTILLLENIFIKRSLLQFFDKMTFLCYRGNKIIPPHLFSFIFLLFYCYLKNTQVIKKKNFLIKKNSYILDFLIKKNSHILIQ